MKELTEKIIKKCEEDPNDVDWDHLSKYTNLPESFIEKYKKYINWDIICTFQKLSEPFIEKHINNINWGNISCSQELSGDFIEKYKKYVNWWAISAYQKLSEDFIEEHDDYLDWIEMSESQKLSEEFIEKHKDRLIWGNICKYQQLSEPFIEKHKDDVFWCKISQYQKLSEDFIEKHKDDVSWYYISLYQKLSESFIEKHKDDLGDLGLQLVLGREDTPDYIKEKYKNRKSFESPKVADSSEKVDCEITADNKEKFVAGVCKVDEPKTILTGKTHYIPEYKKIIENIKKKTVVVLWADDTVTTAHCSKEDIYDFDVGLSLCFSKKMFNNFHNFALCMKNKIERRKKN